MKNIGIKIKHSLYSVLAACILLSLYACYDDEVVSTDDIATGNSVTFNVTSGIITDISTPTKADAKEDTTSLLKPLILRAAEYDKPLYLHTYVADESERATGTATRSAQINNIDDFYTLNGGDGFGVTACYTDNGKSFIDPYATAKPLAQQTGKDIWYTIPIYYWPNSDRMLRFSAFAPMSAKSLLRNLTVDEDKIEFDYIVPVGTDDRDGERQPDIMFATKNCNKKTSVENKVPLNFRHALSSIKFAIRDVVGGTIEKITISGVAGTGHCIYNGESDSDTDLFTWNQLGTTSVSYSQIFDYSTTENFVQDPSNDVGGTDIVLNNTMPEKTFMLIPQELTDNATIQVVFKRDYDGQTITMQGKIRDNNVTKWEPGKEYIYTISTSTSNWIYHFEVIGCNQAINDDAPQQGAFADANGQIVVNQTVTEGAYYKVKSYRVRANNQSYIENIPWQISEPSKITGTTVIPDELNIFEGNFTQDMVIGADVWLPNLTTSGEGSTEFIKYDLDMHAQIVGTSWNGDWAMKANPEKGTKESPIDLSMVNGSRSTANCYVVNCGGYYKIPLVYGNAITNGQTLSSSYTYGGANAYYYPALRNFQDYKGNSITEPRISGAASAMLVWQDAYNLISDVELAPSEGGYDFLSFKINREDLQQGNAVLAIKDAAGNIIWSWHIWINESWVNNDLTLGNGDMVCDSYNTSYRSSFTAAPYNLGWCDPKNIWYMKRVGKLQFIQDISGNSVVLEVEQREKRIEYWIGNNTYYQFGRKDPMVGFMNVGSVVKYNFGTLPYTIEPQTRSIADGIKNPNVMYVGGEENITNSDWLSTSYYNLWNNAVLGSDDRKGPGNTDVPYFYSGIKTVYDPCPAGYQLPPVSFFRLITKNLSYDVTSNPDDYWETTGFNGYIEDISGDRGYYKYHAYTKINGKSGDPVMTFTGTGHRWYGNVVMPAGGNFNPQIVYMWSNQICFTNNPQQGNRIGYGLALGLVSGKEAVAHYYFLGRRAMARPVRPVRTSN